MPGVADADQSLGLLSGTCIKNSSLITQYHIAHDQARYELLLIGRGKANRNRVPGFGRERAKIVAQFKYHKGRSLQCASGLI